jgi:hypothetical protein
MPQKTGGDGCVRGKMGKWWWKIIQGSKDRHASPMDSNPLCAFVTENQSPRLAPVGGEKLVTDM